MNLKLIDCDFSVCKLNTLNFVNLNDRFVFLSVTDEERSLVCPTSSVPKDCLAAEHGWRGFRVEGELDFSLIGILSKLSGVLAEHGISIFAVSTYNTDYILVKADQIDHAIAVLQENGYTFA